MQRNPDILNELGNISKPLSEMPDKPVFSVPDGYFDRFPDLMLLKVKATEMAEAVDSDPAAEIASLSPLLAGLSRDMPMRAPEGFFSAPNVPVEELEAPNPTPVVRMPLRRFHRFAVAASVLAILGCAMLFLRISTQEKTPQAQVNVTAELPGLSEKELHEFLSAFPDLDAGTEPVAFASANLEVEDMIAEVDEKGLEEFLSDMPEIHTLKNN